MPSLFFFSFIGQQRGKTAHPIVTFRWLQNKYVLFLSPSRHEDQHWASRLKVSNFWSTFWCIEYLLNLHWDPEIRNLWSVTNIDITLVCSMSVFPAQPFSSILLPGQPAICKCKAEIPLNRVEIFYTIVFLAPLLVVCSLDWLIYFCNTGHSV